MITSQDLVIMTRDSTLEATRVRLALGYARAHSVARRDGATNFKSARAPRACAAARVRRGSRVCARLHVHEECW